MSRAIAPLALGASIMLGIGSSAQAQWTVTSLHPAGAQRSMCFSVRGGVEAGVIFVNNNFRAAYWSGTPESVVDLNPTGAFQSEGWSAFGTQQVGDTYIASLGPITRAVIWNGAADSWTNLHPAVASFSSARDLDATQQVGIALIDGLWHASLWTGTAASWIDLSPAGTTESQARRVDSGQQVGWAMVSGQRHASLWSGTAASWVDLHPAGSLFSEASGVHNGRQVGWATVNGPQHACIWTGTAASFTDLHPQGAPGVIASYALSIFNDHQAGVVVKTGEEWHAALWTDTAESWEDLSAELTGTWNESAAEDVWDDGETLYVAGWGFNVDDNRYEALLWTRPLTPPPSCVGDLTGEGSTNSSDFNVVASNFGAGPGATLAQGDLTGDGFVNSADFNVLASDFGCVP